MRHWPFLELCVCVRRGCEIQEPATKQKELSERGLKIISTKECQKTHHVNVTPYRTCLPLFDRFVQKLLDPSFGVDGRSSQFASLAKFEGYFGQFANQQPVVTDGRQFWLG